MAESKSDYSASNIKAHFEKTAEYGPCSIKRLSMVSKRHWCKRGGPHALGGRPNTMDFVDRQLLPAESRELLIKKASGHEYWRSPALA
jgi:hypothetical protein